MLSFMGLGAKAVVLMPRVWQIMETVYIRGLRPAVSKERMAEGGGVSRRRPGIRRA